MGRTGPPPQKKTAAEKRLATLTPRFQAFMRGEIKIEDLDIEELTRGQIKGPDGKFTGSRRTGGVDLIPREFHTACVRELRRRLQEEFEGLTLEAIETMADVMRNGEGEGYGPGQHGGTQRFKAAQYIIERVMGKIPDKVEVTAQISPFEEMVNSGELIVDIEVFDDDGEALPPALGGGYARAGASGSEGADGSDFGSDGTARTRPLPPLTRQGRPRARRVERRQEEGK